MNCPRLIKYILWLLLFIASSCIESYQPPAIDSNAGYLVIDGALTVEDGGVITLSRTQDLSDGSEAPKEIGASVSLETEYGLISVLQETSPGQYKLSISSFSSSLKYRLRIVTASGQEYTSAFSSIKQTPDIDSVTMNLEKEGWYLYANTHDSANDTWYYRYEFNEIWEYRSGGDSRFDVITISGSTPGSIQYQAVPRSENIYHCWKKDSTHNITVATSSNLSSDVIYHFPVKLIPEDDWRIFIKYRVKVKQYAISREEYNFWQLLKKNTESTGSLFDPLPSNIKGNFTCTSNPSEPVIGFFSIYSKSEVTINKTYQDLYPNRLSPGPYCPNDTLLLEEYDPETGELIYSFANEGPGPYLITGQYWDQMSNALLGYFIGTQMCVDCRSRLYGGTNNKPSDW